MVFNSCEWRWHKDSFDLPCKNSSVRENTVKHLEVNTYFQWLIDEMMGDRNDPQSHVYLKHVIVVGITLEGYEHCYLRVFNQLGNRCLKLSFGKCQFFYSYLTNFTCSMHKRRWESPENLSSIINWSYHNRCI